MRVNKVALCKVCLGQSKDKRSCEHIKGVVMYAGGVVMCKKHADEYFKNLLEGA